MPTTAITIKRQPQGNVIFPIHLPKTNFNGGGVKWYEDKEKEPTGIAVPIGSCN